MKSQREHWASEIGFILATAGSAIGLGSLWRFPYTAGENGGGAFVLLYILFTFFLGIPVFIAELIIGRASQKSPIFAYEELSRQSAHWKMVGWLNLITCFTILSFYCVISGWCLNYALMSLTQFTAGKSPEQIRAVFDILYNAPDVNLFWLFFFILLNVGVVYGGIRKGSITLEGFPQALRFILYPDFSKLSTSAILDALGMAFFTLSVGMGIILTYGSYLKPQENIPKTGFIVALMTLLVSLMAALIIFPIVFSFGFPPEGGPGLIFKTMPILFAKLKGSLLISTVFFLLLIFTALTSSISLFEVLVANLMEVFNWSRGKAMLFSGGGVFIFGIPSALAGSNLLFPDWKAIYGMDFFETMNYISTSWMMPIAGLFTVIFTGYKMNKTLTQEEFMKGTKMRCFFKPWFFSIRYLAPAAVIIIILEQAKVINLSAIISYFSSAL
ncbi:MAG: sodium-dependent transporter [Simkania negevensis]|nr:sodium-dependent transporter [Simkania negevensis]